MDSTANEVFVDESHFDDEVVVEEEPIPEPVIEKIKPKRTYTRKVIEKDELEQAEEDLENVPYLDSMDWDKPTFMTCPECGWEGYIHSGDETQCSECYNKAIVKIKQIKHARKNDQ